MTEATNTPESHLLKLRIIASLQKNDRLNTVNGFYVDTSIWQGLGRWYNGENRESNLNAVEAVLLDSIRLAHNLLDQRKTLLKTPTDVVLLQNDQQIQSIQREIENALGGLANLAFTYTDSTSAVARIYTITTMVKNSLARLELKYNLVNNIDDSKSRRLD